MKGFLLKNAGQTASSALVRGESPLADGGMLTALLVAESFSRRQLCLVLSMLVLMTAIPRILMAWQLIGICNDGYYYLSVARMWEQGQTEAALSYLNVNTYPLILWGLKSVGLPFAWDFKLWGVLVSCLTVFPLFGLARRLFNDRVAGVAVLLFAIHPELIELSVEPIREPTFWFLFLLTSYLLHRCATSAEAVSKPRLGQGWLGSTNGSPQHSQHLGAPLHFDPSHPSGFETASC